MGEVMLDARGVIYADPRGAQHRLDWADLSVVEIVTTDDGPMTDDVFWMLTGSQAALSIPQTAAGTDALLERLQLLPGFDNQALIAAMSCTRNARFRCWQRGAS